MILTYSDLYGSSWFSRAVTDVIFRVALAVSLAIAFVVAVPVNRWMISRGRGHAVVHEYRHAGAHGPDHG
jgi:hypothetical protein